MRTLNAIALAAGALLCAGAASAQDFVVNGEKIADAALYAAAKKEGSFTLYGTIPTESMSITLDQFKKETGIQYYYIRLPTARMYDRVLAEHGAKKLGADMLARREIEIRPGQTMTVKADAPNGTLYLGVIAGFREIEGAQWRDVYTLDTGSDNRVAVTLQARTMTVARRSSGFLGF